MIPEEEDEREAELSDEDLENDAESDEIIESEDEFGKIIYQTIASLN